MPTNDNLIRALRCEQTDYTPIWIMRQAGRYLPEYRAIREKAGSFLKLCKTPELATEVTLQPVQRFNLDAAILFSDILTIPDAMGMDLAINDGQGPILRNPITHPKEIERLSKPDLETELHYVFSSIRLLRHELASRIPLIGFSGSPWTLMCYMIEGGSSKDFMQARALLNQEPCLADKFFHQMAETIADYLILQARAGADVLMLFDSWGGLLNKSDYLQFSLASMCSIIARVRAAGILKPMILFSKGCGQWVSTMASSGASAIGIDWTTDIRAARAALPENMAIQGNLDPALLFADEDKLVAAAKSIMDAYGTGNGHIFNLGHGIHQHTDPGKVNLLVEIVHNHHTS